MRYRCFCRPSLPINAFQPRGAVVGRPSPFARGMTLEGGCSIPVVRCVVNTVSCWVCSAAQTIGNWGSQLDSSVRSAVPGGWATLGALAATVASMGAASGMLASDLAVESTVAMEDGSVLTTFSDGSTALTDASGATTYTSAGGEAVGSVNTSTSALPNADPTVGGTPADAPAPAPSGDAVSNLPSGGSTLNDPSLTTQIGANPNATGSTFGSLTPPATGSGAIPGAGAVTNGAGLTGALPAGTIVGDGTAGTVLGQTYMAAAPGQFALDSFGNPIIASSVGIGGFAPSAGGISLSDLKTARSVANTVKGLFAPATAAKTVAGAKPTTTTTSGALPTTTAGTSGSQGITPLAAGTMKGNQIALNSLVPSAELVTPTSAPVNEAFNPLSLQEIQNAKTGGSMVPHYCSGGGVCEPVRGPGTARGSKIEFSLKHPGLDLLHGSTAHMFKNGGAAVEHVPEFHSEGGLKHTYVKGKGDGTSDSIPAMLANGEFVIPADVVSSLGNGSNDSGAKVLDEFLRTIRKHKRNADANDLPPDSKGALGYLLEAKKKVKK